MKLSTNTINILKNFGTINSNLIIKGGQKKLTTISPHKNIMAHAVLSEEFPVDFGIYDVNEFLGAMSLFNDPTYNFTDKYVEISENDVSLKYFAANQSILTPVPTIKPFPNPDIEFELSSKQIQHIQRAASILKSTDFSIQGNGSTISLVVGDKVTATGNTFRVVIADTDKKFNINFKIDNLKMILSDYTIAIGAKQIARFTTKDEHITYYIALELDSTFDF